MSRQLFAYLRHSVICMSLFYLLKTVSIFNLSLTIQVIRARRSLGCYFAFYRSLMQFSRDAWKRVSHTNMERCGTNATINCVLMAVCRSLIHHIDAKRRMKLILYCFVDRRIRVSNDDEDHQNQPICDCWQQ